MERRWWRELNALACRLGVGIPEGHRFSAACIVGVYLWAVIHDRPVVWACDPENWPAECLARPLPSQSTMSRRLRSGPVRRLLVRMEEYLQCAQSEWVKRIDAKPLLVGAHSKAADAKWGRASGGSWKGYKLYTLWGQDVLPIAWEVSSMNVSEPRMARNLLPFLQGGGYVLGDKIYDVNYLYDATGRWGHQLVAKRKYSKAAGLGHHRHSPYRLRAIELLKGEFGQALYRDRGAIERCYGGLTNFGGGLAPLPNWVRTLPRVRLWLRAKFLIHAIRRRAAPPPSQLAIA